MRIDPSIQDFCKRINSKILTSFHSNEVVTVCLLSLSLFFFMVFLSFWTKDDRHTFVYKEGDIAVKKINTKSDRDLSFFGSKNGKVYYYSWCKAGNKIKESNRIYFESEGEAKGGGRTLSKLCK